MPKSPNRRPGSTRIHREDAEDAERGGYFWRIGERPILQKLHACGHKNMPKRLRPFDLPRVLLGTNQKQFSLCDLGASAVRILFWTRMNSSLSGKPDSFIIET